MIESPFDLECVISLTSHLLLARLTSKFRGPLVSETVLLYDCEHGDSLLHTMTKLLMYERTYEQYFTILNFF